MNAATFSAMPSLMIDTPGWSAGLSVVETTMILMRETEFEQHLRDVQYAYTDETGNPAYQMFVGG